MSWARDEWKEGLTAQALRKVGEYEESLERNRKDLQQRQFQLDSLNVALQKQKMLTEEQKNVGIQYKRELQTVSEKCDAYEKSRERIMADLHMKDSRINCLDGLLKKEKQALESEVSKCHRLKVDLESHVTKYDHLLSEYNKLQKDVQAQQRNCGQENGVHNISRASSSDSEPEREVFPFPKVTPRKIMQEQVHQTRTSSSSSSEDVGRTPSHAEIKVKELQRSLESVRKEKESLYDKWQKSVQNLDTCQSKLVAMENKQKQLVQEIECSRHNVEAGRRHQEERMKEKEQEYRDEISSQTKALLQLEQDLKETKIRLDQEQKSLDVKSKEFESTTKQLRKEIEAAKNEVKAAEFEKNEKSAAVEKCGATISELKRELSNMKLNKDVSVKSHEESMKTINSLNQQLENCRSDLEESKRTVGALEESTQALVAQERAKYLDLLKTREEERNCAVAKLKELEGRLEEMNTSSSEKEKALNKQIEELTTHIEKAAPLLEQKEQQMLALRISLDEKNEEIESMSVILEKHSNPEKLKSMTEEKVLLEGKLAASQQVSESLKQKVKECEVELSQFEAKHQMLQMDIEDRDQMVGALKEQKSSLEYGFQEKLQKISDLETNIRVADEQLGSLKSESEALKNCLKEREEAERHLQEELEHAKGKLEGVVAQKTALVDELSKAEEEREKKGASYQTKIQEMETLLKKTKSEKETITVKFNTTLLENKIFVEKLASAEQQILDYENEVERMQKELDGFNSSAQSSQEKLKQDLENMRLRLEDAKEKLESTKTELAEKENSINELVSAKESLDYEIKGIKSENQDVKGKYEKSVNDNKILEEKLTASEEETSKYKMIFEQREDELANLKKHAESVETKLNEELKGFKECLKREEDRLESARGDIKEKELAIQSLHAEKEVLEIEIQNMKSENKGMSQEIERSANERRVSVEKLAASERIVGEVNAMVERLQQELNDSQSIADSARLKYEQQIENLVKTFTEEKAKMQAVKDELNEQTTLVQAINSEKESLLFEVQNVQAEKEVITKNLKRVQEESKNAVEKLSTCEKQLCDYKLAVETLEKELSEAKDLMEANQETVSKNLTRVQKELTKEEAKLETTRNELREKDVSIQILLSEKETLLFQIEDMKKENQVSLEKIEKYAKESRTTAEKLSSSEQHAGEYKVMLEQIKVELSEAKSLAETSQIMADENVGKLQKELAEEKAILEAVKDEVKEKDAALQMLLSEKESLLFQNESMKAENQVSLEKIEKYLNESRISADKLSVSEQRVDEYKVLLDQLQLELSESKSLVERSQTTADENLRKFQGKLAEEKAKLETLRNEIEEKDTSIQTLNSGKKSLLFQIESMKAENQVSLEKIEKYVNESRMSSENLSAREQQVNEYKIMVEQLQAELSEAKDLVESSKTTADEHLRKLESELTEEKAKLEAVGNEVKEKDVAIQMLESERESLIFQNESIKAENQVSSAKVDKYMNESRISLEKLFDSEKQVGEYKLRVEQLQQNLLEAKSLIESSETMADEKFRKLHSELTEEKQRLETTKSELKEKDVALQILKSDKETLVFQIENSKAENQISLEKIEKYTNELKVLLEKLTASEKDASEYRAMVKKLQVELTGSKELIEAGQVVADENLRKVQSELSGEKTKLEKVMSKLYETENILNVIKNEKGSMVFEIDNLKAEKQVNLETIEKVVDENKSLLEKLTVSKQETVNLELRVKQLEREVAEEREVLQTRQASFDGDVTDLKNRLAEEVSKSEKMNGDLQEKEAMVCLMKTTKDSLEFEIEQLKSQNDKLSSKLELTRQECRAVEDKLIESSGLVVDYEKIQCDTRDLKTQLSLKDEELNSIKIECAEIKSRQIEEIGALKEEMGKKDILISEREHELNKAKDQVDSHLEKIKEAELENKRVEERHEAKTAEFEKEMEKLRKLSELMVQEKENALGLVETLQRQLEEKNSSTLLMDKETERERAQLLKKIENASRDIKEIESNLVQKDEVIHRLHKQIQDQATQKDRERHEVMLGAKEEHERLNDKIRHWKTECDELKRDMKSVKEDLESQIREKNTHTLEMEKQLSKISTEKQRLETENLVNLEKIRKADADLVKESEKVESSCRRIDELLSSKRQEHDAMLSAERDFSKVRGELECEIKVLREKVDKQHRELGDAEETKRKLQKLQRDSDETREALERSNEKFISLQQSFKDVNSEKERLCHELKSNIDAYESLKRSTGEEKDRLENDIENCKRTIENLKDKLHRQKFEVENVAQLLRRKDEELFVINKKLDSKIGDAKRLEEANEASQAVEIELRQHLGVVTKELEKYKNDEGESEELVKANQKVKDLEDALLERSSKLEEEREEILAKTKDFVLQREKEYSEKSVYLEGELVKKEQSLTEKCEEICQLSHRLEAEQRSKEILMKEIEEREEKMDFERAAVEKGPLTPNRLKALESDLEDERRLSKSLQEKCVMLDELVSKEQTNRVALQQRVKNLQALVTGLEEKEDKISALESQVEVVSQQLESVRDQVEAEKIINAALEKEAEQLKDKELVLEKQLQDEVRAHEILRKDYEQLKQKESDLDKSVSLLCGSQEGADSMKVSELECYIDELKDEVATQQERMTLAEDSLKSALESKGVLERSLQDKLKENEELKKDLEEKLGLVESLEERITNLEMHVAGQEKENELAVFGLKAEIKTLEETTSTQKHAIDQFEEKIEQLQLLVQEKTANLSQSEKVNKGLEVELEEMKKLLNGANSDAEELSKELQHVKRLLKESCDNLETEKHKTAFMETLKEKLLVLEEKCSELTRRCSSYMVKLDEERLEFGRERKAFKDRISTLCSSYDDVKLKLKEAEEQHKPMMERLFELEGALIMQPKTDVLQQEIARLKKDLEEEKENATRSQELSKKYLGKLNELNAAKSRSPTVSTKKTQNDHRLHEQTKETLSRHGQTLKSKPKEGPSTQRMNKVQNHEKIVGTPLLQDEKEVHFSPLSIKRPGYASSQDGQEANNASVERQDFRPAPSAEQEKKKREITGPAKVLSSVQEEAPPFLSPITHSISKLRFSSPSRGNIEAKKSRSTKTAMKSGIQKPTVTLASNLPPEKKRKDEDNDKDKQQSKAKRARLGSVSAEVRGVRSPFVLRRNRDAQARGKTSSSQSHLPQPGNKTTRSSRIPKATAVGASGRTTEATGEKNVLRSTKIKPASEECKMQ